MMRPDSSLTAIYLCTHPIDFRKGILGLAALVENGLDLNPLGEGLFVFTNRHRNKIKILYWEKNGFCLWQKRLEKDRFHWFKNMETPTKTITGQQLNWLLDGYNLNAMKGHEKLTYSTIL